MLRGLISSLLVAACLAVCALPATAGRNLLDNSSFEVSRNHPYLTGSDRWGMFQEANPTSFGHPEKRCWYIDSSTAWHGKNSLRIVGEAQGSYFRVKPGVTYTVTCYAKPSKANTLIRLACQAGERTGYVVDGPAERKEFRLQDGWQRVEMQFTSVPTKSNAYYLGLTVYGQNPVWFDAFQVEEGSQATAYAPKSELEGWTFVKPTSQALGMFCPGEPVDVITRTYPINALAGLVITHRLLDHHGRLVAKQSYRARSAESTCRLKLKRLGHFRVHTDITAGGKTYRDIAEAGFIVIPKLEGKLAGASASRFGCRAMLPPFPKFASEGFLPQSVVADSYLSAEGRRPPWQFGGVLTSMAQKIGIRWIRLDQYLNWDNIEPEKGKFDWEMADLIVNEVHRRGFAIQAIFAQSPLWCHPAEPDGRAGPDNVHDWIDFLDRVSSRYKGKIKAYEIWNETFSNFLGTPQQYAELLNAAYKTIKKNDANALVLGISACPPEYSWRFTKDALKLGCLNYMDAMSYHHKLLSWTGKYPGMPDEGEFPWETSIEKLRQYMRDAGGMKPFWNTEFDVWSETQYQNLVRGACGGSYEYYKVMPLEDGPSGIVRCGVVSFANDVRMIQFFSTNVIRTSSISAWSGGEPADFPLGEAFAEFDYTPRPTAAAWGSLAWQVAGAKFVKQIKMGSRGRAFLFDGGRGPLAVMWALRSKGRPGILTAPAQAAFLKVYDVMSNPIRGFARARNGSSMKLGMEPVFVRGASLGAMEKILSRAVVQGKEGLPPDGIALRAAACLHSTDNKGSLAMAVRLENRSGDDVKPAITVKFGDPRFKAGSAHVTASLGAGQSELYEVPVSYSSAPESAQTSADISIAARPWKTSVQAPVSLAYAARVDRPIVRDRKPDDYIALGEKQIVIGRDAWKGPQDLSAQVFARYDKANLYLAVYVKDHYPLRNSDPARLWDGTCVELYLDLDQIHDIGDDQYNRDDFHIMLAPGFTEAMPDAIRITDNSGRPDFAGVIAKSVRTSDGYDMEITLPRTLFDFEPWPGGAGMRFGPGLSVGFAISIANRAADKPGRQTMLLWGGTERNWQNPTMLGTLVLAP